MPLRRVVSHTETISEPGQYETLERPLEAVYGPYSTSAPCTMHSTIDSTGAQNDTEHEQPPSAVVVRATRVAILTVLTRQKSQRTKEIGCYRVRGGGRGCDPAHAHRALAVLGPAPAFPQEINAMELSTNSVPALSGPCCWTSFL